MCKEIEVRVYVTNLGKYNEGELIGEWLELPATDEEIQAVMDKIGVKDGTEYEEYFITDYETNCGYTMGEYTSIDTVNEDIQNMIAAENDAGLWEALFEYSGRDDIEGLCSEVSRGYYQFYEDMTAEEYEQQLVEDCYNLSFEKLGWLSNYIDIDYERMARDDDRIYETENGVLIAC